MALRMSKNVFPQAFGVIFFLIKENSTKRTKLLLVNMFFEFVKNTTLWNGRTPIDDQRAEKEGFIRFNLEFSLSYLHSFAFPSLRRVKKQGLTWRTPADHWAKKCSSRFSPSLSPPHPHHPLKLKLKKKKKASQINDHRLIQTLSGKMSAVQASSLHTCTVYEDFQLIKACLFIAIFAAQKPLC